MCNDNRFALDTSSTAALIVECLDHAETSTIFGPKNAITD